LPGSARSLLEPSPHAVRTQYDQVIDSLARELPAVGAMWAEAREEVSHLHELPEESLANDLVHEPA
jgi:transposase-like protein